MQIELNTGFISEYPHFWPYDKKVIDEAATDSWKEVTAPRSICSGVQELRGLTSKK